MDTGAGLRINAKCQGLDMSGEIIQGLYCGGESAGGFSQHGLARAACQGYIAGNPGPLAPTDQRRCGSASRPAAPRVAK
jgi:hypothetical protein